MNGPACYGSVEVRSRSTVGDSASHELLVDTFRPERHEADPSLRNMKTILLVDHKKRHRIAAKWFLSNFGFAVDMARNAEEALILFDPKVHDVVVTEYLMPGMTGVELAHVIKLRSCSTPVIMFAEQPTEHQSCLDCIIQKPAHLLVVKEAVDRLLAVGHN